MDTVDTAIAEKKRYNEALSLDICPKCGHDLTHMRVDTHEPYTVSKIRGYLWWRRVETVTKHTSTIKFRIKCINAVCDFDIHDEKASYTHVMSQIDNDIADFF